MARKRAPKGSGTVRQRADGRWEARAPIGIDPGTGKQQYAHHYAKTETEAAKWLRKTTAAVDEGAYQQPSKMTLGQWADIWMTDYSGHLKPGTLSLYKRHVKNYIKPFLASVKLSALAPHQIQGLYNRLQQGKDGAPKLTPKTIQNLHGVLHKLLQQAVRLSYLKVNPSDACERPRVEKEEVQYLDQEQINAFLHAIQGHRFERLYNVCLFIGIRQAEALGLAWDGIDFEKGTIRLYQQLQLIEGKYQFGPLKNDKPRTITAAPSVMATLREQKRQQAEWRLQAGQAWEDSGLVFTDELGHHLARQTVYQQFKKIVNSIGIPATRFHGMRHSYAVASIQAGDDIKTVQENLGHHTAAFTLDQYGHVTEQMKQASANRMEAFIQSVKKL